MAVGVVRRSLTLFEPEQIKRNSDQAQLKQKTHILIEGSFMTPSMTTTASINPGSILAPGCAAQVKIKDASTPISAKVKWALSCKEGVLTTVLGLSASDVDALRTLLPTFMDATTDKIEIQGSR